MKLTKTHWILLVLIAIVGICLLIKNKRSSSVTTGNKSPESSYKKSNGQLIRDCYGSGGQPIVNGWGTFIKCETGNA